MWSLFQKKPKPPKEITLMVHFNTIQRFPKEQWDSLGVDKLLVHVDSGERLYNNFTLTQWQGHVFDFLHDFQTEIVPAFWGFNPRTGSTLVDWNDTSGWHNYCLSLAGMCHAAKGIGCKQIALDAENYAATPNNNGGIMNPKKAWLDHEKVKQRAEQFQASLMGMAYSHYVYFKGMESRDRKYPGYNKWTKMLKGTLYMEDTYLVEGVHIGSLAKEARGLKVEKVVTGVKITNNFRKQPKNAGMRAGLLGKQCDGVWLYPWTGVEFDDELFTALQEMVEVTRREFP